MIFQIRITFFAFILLVTGISWGSFSGGNGTQTDPYLISSVTDLQQLATKVNTQISFSNAYYKQTADIDLSSFCNKENGVSWTPIGALIPFQGHFNGSGHTISNLYINAPDSCKQGLFGFLHEATIDSVILIKSSVTGKNFIGGLCGSASKFTKINYCSYSGNVNGSIHVGGICGFFNESFLNHVTSIGSVRGKNSVGGLIGSFLESAVIKNSVNSSIVSGITNVGGVCGFSLSSTIDQSTNIGIVYGKSRSVSGICGYFVSSTIKYSVNDGTIHDDFIEKVHVRIWRGRF